MLIPGANHGSHTSVKTAGHLKGVQARVAASAEIPHAPLTVAQVVALFTAARAHKKGKLIPSLALVLFSGLHFPEVYRLSPANIDINAGRVLVGEHGSKDHRARLVQIPPNTREWLRVYTPMNPVMDQYWAKDYRRIQQQGGVIVPPVGLRHTHVTFRLHQNRVGVERMYWTGIAAASLHRLFTQSIKADDVADFWNLTPTSLPSVRPAADLVLQECS